MTVMVNELQRRPLHELHAFAQAIGLKPAWFQHHRTRSGLLGCPQHLTPSRRVLPLQHGAVFVPMKEQLRARRGAGS